MSITQARKIFDRLRRTQHQANNNRQTITEAITPTESAIKPAGIAWRVRRIPAAPK